MNNLISIINESEMLALGKKIAQACNDEAVIYLEGELGAGKTTLVRGFLRAFNYNEKVKSPTFTLVEPYFLPNKTIYHFDLYRLKDPQELLAMGIEDYFSQHAIVLIEWPEKGMPILVAPDLKIIFTVQEELRKVEMQSFTAKGEEILIRLDNISASKN